MYNRGVICIKHHKVAINTHNNNIYTYNSTYFRLQFHNTNNIN